MGEDRMTVISKSVAEAAIALHRHSDETFAVRWLEDVGSGYEPKDLSAWGATMTLETESCIRLASVECSCTSDGYVIAEVPQSTIEALMPHRSGHWRIVGTLGEVTELIGDGYFEVVM